MVFHFFVVCLYIIFDLGISFCLYSCALFSLICNCRAAGVCRVINAVILFIFICNFCLIVTNSNTCIFFKG
jgi:hypothetical protein